MRKVNFDEAYAQNSQSFKLLNFLTLLYRNLRLKFLIFRNSSNSLEVMELEDSIHNGIPFWEKHIVLPTNDKTLPKSTSEKIIQKILQKKKGRENMFEDIRQMTSRLRGLNKWLEKQYASNVDLQIGKCERIIDLLTLHNHIIYKRILIGVDQMIDTYID
jgi:hypothetical protein